MTPESSTRSSRDPLRVVIAGGGTGGHISPALAVVDRLRRVTMLEPHWVGSARGFERQAAEDAGIPFYAIRTGKLRRYLAIETLADVIRVPAGVVEAVRLLRRLKPDVVFSTGGFVSTPTVVAARLAGIPSLTHEQTASIGLATRINARFVDIIALSYSSNSSIRTRRNSRVIVTGNPVRPSVMSGQRAKLLSLFDIPSDVPILYVTGGAQGAHALNEVVIKALPELIEDVAIVHQCGPQSGNGDHAIAVELRESLSPAERVRYYPVQRVGDELAHIYAAASMVLGRAGAGTVAEMAALGLPSILVPLPGADEQVKNARILADAGGALLIRQDDLTPDVLVKAVRSLVNDAQKCASMRASALSVAPDDPVGKLCDALIDLANRS